MVPIDPNSHVPIYQQIVEHIRGAIAARVHRPGETLPSIRTVASELAVNPNTVQRAYQKLEAEGLITPRKGVGMIVARLSPESAQSTSAAAIQDSFAQGIQIGIRADLSAERIRAVFDRTLKDNIEEAKKKDADWRVW